MKKKFLVTMLLIAVLMLGTAVVYAAIVTIDDFEGVTQSESLTAPGTAYSVMADTNALGGERDFELIFISGSRVSLGSNVGNPTPSGALAFSAESGSSGRATVTYDGIDNDAAAIDYNGLCNPTCLDLTDSGNNSHLRIRVIENDLPTLVHFRLYNGTTGLAADYNEYDVSLPGGIPLGNPVDFLMDLASPSQVGGAGASPAAVGAIQIFYNPAPDAPTLSVDVAIDFFEATGQSHDYGDLPDSYGTLSASGGASHILSSGLRLGTQLDSESDGVPTVDATGDAADVNDEDGVKRVASVTGSSTNGGWTNGTAGTPNFNGGALEITINGSDGGAVPQVFIDFDGIGVGGGLVEVPLLTLLGAPIAATLGNGTHTVYFDIPAGTFDGTNTKSIPVRVRLSDAGGLTATGEAPDGEVEDYIFGFGPTAVSLQDLAASASSSPLSLIAVLVLALVGTGIIISRRQRA